MNTPPTTDRAWNPTCLPLSAQYQSVSGTRSGVRLRKTETGAMRESKSLRDSARVAVQRIQSSFVQVLRLSSGRPKAQLPGQIERHLLPAHVGREEMKIQNPVPDEVVLLAPGSGPVEGEPEMVAVVGPFHPLPRELARPPS